MNLVGPKILPSGSGRLSIITEHEEIFFCLRVYYTYGQLDKDRSSRWVGGSQALSMDQKARAACFRPQIHWCS